jgi:5-deoxy-glucuronate isomerase
MSILIKPNIDTSSGIYQKISPDNAGWKWLSFEARLMKKGQQWIYQTGTNEMVIVLLGGNFQVSSNRGSWETINGRKDVFSGVAHTLIPSSQHTIYTHCNE